MVKSRGAPVALAVVAAVVAGSLHLGLAQETPKAPAPTGTPGPCGWYQWLGPNRDGISTEKDWSPKFPAQPKLAWKAKLGAGYSAVTVSGGRAYTMGNSGNKDTIWCFNADSGQKIWQHDYDCKAGDYPGPRCTVAVDGQRAFALSRIGHFFCLDAAKGNVLWVKDVPKDFGTKVGGWGLANSPLLLGDEVILDVGAVVAMKRDTGRVVWQSQPYPVGFSSVMPFELDGRKGLASFNAMGLVILNAADGKELARHPWKTEYDVNAATPIYADKKVFISSGYDVGCALLDITRGKPQVVWQSKVMRNHFTTCILSNGFLYGFDESELKCVDFKTGQERWKQGGLGKGSLSAAGDKLILISEGGELVTAEASPAGYKQISRARVLSATCWTMPVLAGGKIYVRNSGGDMAVVDVGAKAD